MKRSVAANSDTQRHDILKNISRLRPSIDFVSLIDLERTLLLSTDGPPAIDLRPTST